MTTAPHHDVASICLDARRVLDAGRTALHDADFKKRVSKHELDVFQANIEKLEAGSGARSTSLHSQVAAGVHAATARAALIAFFADVRDDAKLAFPSDKAMQHAFGVGVSPSPGSTSEVRHEADVLLASAAAHKAEAKEVGLDTSGVHHLEDLVHALDGADLAHVHATTSRHSNTTATDSQAHLVSAEAAHLRLVARRVYRGQDGKLTPFARTLPRRAITPRQGDTPPPAPPGGGAPPTPAS
jgi:hypothetical protein